MPFEQVVNDVLRTGLLHLDAQRTATPGPFTTVVSLGRPRLLAVDAVGEALAVAEGEDHR